MTSLHRLVDELESLVHQGCGQALTLAQEICPLVRAQPSRLLEARCLLACTQIPGHGRPVADLIQDLLRALSIFRANGRGRDAARCLVRLSRWYSEEGLDLAALAAGRAALRLPDLHLDDRLSLLPGMCIALAHQLRMPAAWSLIDEVGAGLERAPREGAVLRSFDLTRAAMHFIEAVRAACIRSVYALDLMDSRRDLAARDHHLAACGGLLDNWPLSQRNEPAVVHLRALCAAVHGDAQSVDAWLPAPAPGADNTFEEVLHLYNRAWCLRVLGRLDEAEPLLRQACAALARAPVGKLQAIVEYDLAQCHGQKGFHEAAFNAMERFTQRRAALYAAEAHAARRLQEAVEPHAVVRRVLRPDLPDLPNPPDRAAAPSGDAALRNTEPPYLAQAERLLIEQLPRRLSVAHLAAHLGVSLRTLQQATRRYRGLTFGELLRERLIQESLRLMRDTDLSLRDIAARCGYGDASAFSRDFKRVNGSAPSLHRGAMSSRGPEEIAPD